MKDLKDTLVLFLESNGGVCRLTVCWRGSRPVPSPECSPQSRTARRTTNRPFLWAARKLNLWGLRFRSLPNPPSICAIHWTNAIFVSVKFGLTSDMALHKLWVEELGLLTYKTISLSSVRGLPYMTSAKFLDPPCHIQKSPDFVPFVCFLVTPSPHPLRTS